MYYLINFIIYYFVKFIYTQIYINFLSFHDVLRFIILLIRIKYYLILYLLIFCTLTYIVTFV